MKLAFWLTLLIVYFPSILMAGTCWDGGSSGSSPWTVLDGSGGSPSCARADVNYCINTANAGGDTVNVTATGTCNWATQTSITKAIKLVGAGIDQTTLKWTGGGSGGGSALLQIYPSANVSIEVTGFTLDGGGTPGSVHDTGVAAFKANCHDTSGQLCTKINVHGNKFQNGYYGVYLVGEEEGVFWNNQYSGNYTHIYAGSLGASKSRTIGTDDFPFFEDETFGNTDGAYISETGQGASIVMRYCTATGFSGSEIQDQHGDNRDGLGTVVAEIYNNTFGVTGNTQAMYHRGGLLLYYNNTVSGGTGSIKMTEYKGWWWCTADGYPKPVQINNSYFYNNSGTSAPSLNCADGDSCHCMGGEGTCTADKGDNTTGYCNPQQGDSTYIQSERDYFTTTNPVGTSIGGVTYAPYTYPHPLRGSYPTATLNAGPVATVGVGAAATIY